MSAGVVFAHGAFHGPWCWERVQGLLEDEGIATSASDLCRPTTADDVAAFQADVNEMRARLGSDAVVIAVGHSLGGLSISGLDPATVDHLVYLSAVLPIDESGPDNPPDPYSGVIAENFFPALAQGDDGYTSVKPGAAGDLFYHDCSPADVAWAESQLRPQPLGQAPQAYARAAWRDVESTYIVCADDRTLAVEFQRACARLATRVVELEGSHSPMLAQPDAVAAVIAPLAARQH